MRSYAQYCGLALALDLVGDRWTLLIVRELLTGSKRFRDLQDGLPGIATNLLTNRLRLMEERALVERRVLPPPAGSTAYMLTDLGAELASPVHALVRWGGHFMRERHRGQAFQPHWLGVALQALGIHVDLSAEPFVLEIELPEGSMLLTISHTGVDFPAPEPHQPDVWMRGPATCILGLAAGELSWKAALDAGLHVEGSEAAIENLQAVMAETTTKDMAARGSIPGQKE